MRLKLVTHRKLYYVLVAALCLVSVLKFVNDETSRVRLVGEPWLGLAGALLLIGLLVVVFIDRGIARQMIWPGAPFEPYRLSERAIVSAVRVACLVGIALTIGVAWPTVRSALRFVWPR